MMNWKNKTILITGGTGSFGRAFTKFIIKKRPKSLRIFDSDEYSQFEFSKELNDQKVSFLLGKVEDKDRLVRAMEGADIVVHAAALKQVPILENNPFEAVNTNILGSKNVVDAAIDTGVQKVMLISTDKAVSPTNLYGATKMVAEKMFIQANTYASGKKTALCVVRYGNVMASRGSVVPTFLEQAKTGTLTITHEDMTRFWITLEEGVMFVTRCIEIMIGGETFIPKLPSVKITNLAITIAPDAKLKNIGIREGEKIHEVLISEDESRRALEFNNYFIIKPFMSSWGAKNYGNPHPGKKLKTGFIYSSGTNKTWLTPKDIKKLLNNL